MAYTIVSSAITSAMSICFFYYLTIATQIAECGTIAASP